MKEKFKYIAGLGNYAKNDDGIGLRVIEYIVENNLDSDFQALEIGNDGMTLLTYFNKSTEKIVLVDCALMGRNPGECLVLDLDDISTNKTTGNISTHEGDILKLVELAEMLEYPVPTLKIIAIEPDSLEMEMNLSKTLESNLEKYAQTAINTLRD